MLSKEALQVLNAILTNQSLNVPVAVVKQIVELQEWVKAELENEPKA